MNYTETGDLIARVKVGDNRKLDEVATRALIVDWHAAIGHLDFFDCLEAVRVHRGTSTEYLGSAHIAAGVKLIVARRERAGRVQESIARRAIAAPVINLDREQFERDTRASIEHHRRLRGLDITTGKPLVTS